MSHTAIATSRTLEPGRALLRVKDLRVEFETPKGKIVAVEGITYSLYAGEILAIIGESGSGKSVSAESLLGLNLRAGCHISGSIYLRDRNILSMSARELGQVRGREMALIFQDSTAALNPALSVGYQLGEVFRARLGVNRRGAHDRSIRALEMVGLPDPIKRMKSYPHELSGGMRQRVMIALAIALNPALLVADEPTTALDVTIQSEVLRLLLKLRDELGMAILLITHDLAVAREIADTAAVMYSGRFVEYGPAETVFSEPKHPYTRGLLASTPKVYGSGSRLIGIKGNQPDPLKRASGCAFHPRCEFAVKICETHEPALRPLGDESVACHLSETLPSESHPTDAVRVGRGRDSRPRDELLCAVNLRREFQMPVSGSIWRRQGVVAAVSDVSLTLFPQETVAVVGESGSGKSTLARMMGRLLRPTSGTVAFRGTDIWQLDRDATREFRKNVQMVFQDPFGSLDPRVRIGDAIREPWVVNRLGLTRKEQDRRVAELLDDVGLSRNMASRRPSEVSGGQRQRLAIARALAMKPSILICDEPTSALDVSVQAQILELLRTLQSEHRMSYVLISHDLAIVRSLADRVLVMLDGAIVEANDVAELFERPRHPYTQKLLASIPGQSTAAAEEAFRDD